jgi:hypothetical protein
MTTELENKVTAVEPTGVEVPVVTGGGQAPPTGGEVPTNDWQKEKATYEEKLKGFSDYDDYKQAATLLASYLQADSNREKDFYQWRDGGRQTPTPTNQPTSKKSEVDLNSLKQEMMQELQREIEPQKKVVAQFEAEREKSEMQKKHSWFTDELYQKLDGLFGQKVEQEIKKAMQEDRMNYPMAKFLVENRYRVPLETLAFQLMPDEFLKNISAGKRTPQQLPPGMKGVAMNGVTPTAMEQAVKEYRASKPGEDSAKVFQKWANDFGLQGADRDEFLKTLRGD